MLAGTALRLLIQGDAQESACPPPPPPLSGGGGEFTIASISIPDFDLMSGKEAAPAASMEIDPRTAQVAGAGPGGLPRPVEIRWGRACPSRGSLPPPGRGGAGPARPVAGADPVAGTGRGPQSRAPVAGPGSHPIAGARAGVWQCTSPWVVLLVAEL